MEEKTIDVKELENMVNDAFERLFGIPNRKGVMSGVATIALESIKQDTVIIEQRKKNTELEREITELKAENETLTANVHKFKNKLMDRGDEFSEPYNTVSIHEQETVKRANSFADLLRRELVHYYNLMTSKEPSSEELLELPGKLYKRSESWRQKADDLRVRVDELESERRDFSSLEENSKLYQDLKENFLSLWRYCFPNQLYPGVDEVVRLVIQKIQTLDSQVKLTLKNAKETKETSEELDTVKSILKHVRKENDALKKREQEACMEKEEYLFMQEEYKNLLADNKSLETIIKNRKADGYWYRNYIDVTKDFIIQSEKYNKLKAAFNKAVSTGWKLIDEKELLHLGWKDMHNRQSEYVRYLQNENKKLYKKINHLRGDFDTVVFNGYEYLKGLNTLQNEIEKYYQQLFNSDTSILAYRCMLKSLGLRALNLQEMVDQYEADDTSDLAERYEQAKWLCERRGQDLHQSITILDKINIFAGALRGFRRIVEKIESKREKTRKAFNAAVKTGYHTMRAVDELKADLEWHKVYTRIDSDEGHPHSISGIIKARDEWRRKHDENMMETNRIKNGISCIYVNHIVQEGDIYVEDFEERLDLIEEKING